MPSSSLVSCFLITNKDREAQTEGCRDKDKKEELVRERLRETATTECASFSSLFVCLQFLSNEAIMSILICSKVVDLTNRKMVKLEIPDLTLGMTVDDLYDKIAKHLDLDVNSVELVAYGRFLQKGKTLGYYGVRSSSVIFVHNKRPQKDTESTASSLQTFDQIESHRIVTAVKTALLNPDFRTVIEKLKEKEAQDNLMAVTPGLSDDPIAMSILLDYDMLSLCTEGENIAKVLEKHPSLGTAATFLAAQFHEEHTSTDIFRRSPHPAYSLDDMTSDDEETEMADPSQQAGPSSQAGPSNEQLAQLLRQAIDDANRGNSSRSAPLGNLIPRVTPPSVVTSAMLQDALRTINAGSVPPSASSSSVESTPRRDWSTELRQMQDMGIMDVEQCIQALEMTNGNVAQALDIIFNSS